MSPSCEEFCAEIRPLDTIFGGGAMLRLLTLTAVLALAACANSGDEGMIVLNNTAVTATCTLTGSSSQPFIAHGQIYAKSPNGYLLTPLIQSRVVMTDSTDVSQRTIL